MNNNFATKHFKFFHFENHTKSTFVIEGWIYGTTLEEDNVFGDVISFSIYVYGILIGSSSCRGILYLMMCSYTNVVYGYDKEYITLQQTYIFRKNTWPPRSQRVAWIIWFSLTWRDLQDKTIIKSWPIILLHNIDKTLLMFTCLRCNLNDFLWENYYKLMAITFMHFWAIRVVNALFKHL